jgi:TRAP-type C4-dicarboxylate transport system substrate-binding protein
MKKAFGFLSVMIMSLFLFVGCGANGSTSNSTAAAPASSVQAAKATAPKKVYTIKLVTSNPSTDPTVKLFKKYAEVIKSRTSGGVEVQVYADGEILMGDEGIEAVMSDASVITFNDLDVLGQYVPEFNSLCASFLVDDYVTIERLADSEVYKKIMAKADAANIHVINGSFVMGARNILADDVAVLSVDDCPKLNIRVPNVSSYVQAFNAFKANYSAIGWSAGITAVETGMLNGAECVSQRALTSGLAEILKKPVFSMVQWRNAPVGLEIGNGYWLSLPEEYRTIIEEEFKNCALENNRVIADSEAEYIQKLRDKGVVIIPYEDIDIASFQEAVKSLNESMPMFNEVFATVQNIIASK